jgi:hypothetical protein
MAGMSIPWQVFPIALLGISIAVFVWNSSKMHRRLGDNPTKEEIQRAYPRGKFFTLRRSKTED